MKNIYPSMRRIMAFVALLCLVNCLSAQTTYDFSTRPTLSSPWPTVPSWKTVADVNIGGVDYVLTAGGNGTWTALSSGGNGNSACLQKDGSGGDALFIARKDGKPFQFYGLWLKHSSMLSEYYYPPYYTINYAIVGAPAQSFVYNNTALSSTETYTKNLRVTGVSISFSSLMYYWIDDLIVGPPVAPPIAPTATGTQTNVTCFGGTNGSASVTAASGTAPYTYSWSPSGGTGSTASGLAAGAYVCTVTDAASQTVTKNFTITQPTAIALSSSAQTNVACNGGATGAATINLPTGGAGSYTYNWTPGNPTGDGTKSVTGLAAGAYTVTVTDAIGCTGTQNFTITQPTAISVTPSSQTNVACNGGSNGAVSINSPTGGAGGYTYDWTPGTPSGDGTRTVTGLAVGTYTVTVTDANGCTATQSFTITQPTAISVTAASQTNISCYGGSNGAASINSPTGGAGGYTYNWTPGNPPGDGTGTVTGLAAGTYTVTVTDANSCTATQSFTITQPTPISLSPSAQTNVACNGGATGAATIDLPTGGAGGYTYDWTPGTPTGDGTRSVSGLVAGTYTVTVTDANGCTATQRFTITQPTAISVTASSQTNIACNGGATGAATINTPTGGAGGYTYDWTPGTPTGDGTRSVTGLVAGTYTVTVTDANGCTGTQSFTITQFAPITATTASVDVTCFGGSNGSASVTASGGAGSYTYSWSPMGGTRASISGVPAGTYTCVITDAYSCTTTKSVTITEPEQAVITINSQPETSNVVPGTNASFSVTATGAASYKWQVNDGEGFYNITDGESYSGSGTASLAVISASARMNGYLYRCVLTANCAAPVTTNSVKLSTRSTNAFLSGITINQGSLKPSFSQGTTSYEVEVDPNIASFNITPASANEHSTIKVKGNSATSGSPVSIALNGGSNTVTVVVTAEDGTTRMEYTINVIRRSYAVIALENASAALTNAAVRTFNVSFSGEVNGLNAENLNFTATGTLSGYSIQSVTQTSTSSYDVSVNTGTGSGTLKLNLNNGSGLSAPISELPYTANIGYIIDKSAPVTSAKAVTVKLGADGTAVIAAEDLNDGTTDNMSTGKSITYSVSKSTFRSGDLGQNTITFTATDEAGNSSSQSVIVTVQKDIIAMVPFENKSIVYGDELVLPETVEVTYSDLSKEKLTIEWGMKGYTGKVGVYDISGSITMLENTTNDESLSSSIKVTVTKRTLTVAMQAIVEKVFDGNTNAPVAQINYTSDKINNDDLVFNGEAVYDNRKAGEEKTVTIAELSLGGEDAYNYTLASSTVSGPVGKITPATLRVKLTGVVEKIYNASTDATLSAENYRINRISDDNVVVTGTAVYDNKNAGIEKLVSVSDIKISGDDAANYTLYSTSAQASIGIIDLKPINATLSASPEITKVYDGSPVIVISDKNYQLSDVEDGDDLSVIGDVQYDNEYAGTDKVITVMDLVLQGEDKGNYVLKGNTATTSGNITKKTITVSLDNEAAISKSYDGNTAATLVEDNYVLDGVLKGDEVTVKGNAVYSDKNAGSNKTLTVTGFTTGGESRGNYTLTTEVATVLGSIIPKEISLELDAQALITKEYDATNDATLAPANYHLLGVVDNDDLSVTGSAYYSDRRVGSGKEIAVNGFVLGGADRNNYHLLTETSGTTGNITAKTLEVSLDNVPAVSKIFDSNTDAVMAAENYTVSGIIGKDEVVLNNPAEGVYEDNHAGDNKKVTVTGLSISGEDAMNYVLSSESVSGNIGTIIGKQISITAYDQTKVYGSDEPVLSYYVTGLVGDDGLQGVLRRQIGQDAGSYRIGIGSLKPGNDYTISQFTAGVFTITPAALEIDADDKKRASGTENPEFTFKYTGFKNGDMPSDLKVMPVAATNATAHSPIGYFDINVSGAVSPNYDITFKKGVLSVVPEENSKGNVKAWMSSPNVMELRIFSDVEQKAAIIVYTDLGQPIILQQKQLHPGTNVMSLSLVHLSSSMYMLNVKTKKYNEGQKVPVKK